MQAITDSDGNLVVTSSESWLLLLTVALAAGAAIVWLGHATLGVTLAWSVGLAAGALLCFSGWERSVFVFDRNARTLVWRRVKPFSRAEGRVAFSDVTSLSLQQDFNGAGQRSNARRIVIHTTSGVIPLTSSFEAAKARYQAVAQRIIDTMHAVDPAQELPLVE